MFGGKKKNICPLMGKTCIEHECAWYMNVAGTNPQTGIEFSNWQCAVVFMPLLLMDNAASVRQTTEAAQETRNEVAKARDASNARSTETMKILLAHLHQARIEQAQVVIDE